MKKTKTKQTEKIKHKILCQGCEKQAKERVLIGSEWLCAKCAGVQYGHCFTPSKNTKKPIRVVRK